MSSKHTSKLAQAAAPHLRQGEVVEIGAFTTVGSVSVKRQFLTAAVVGIATGGMVAATVRPAKRFLAVTNERLLFFNGEGTFGRPGKLLFSLPREAVEVVKPASTCWPTGSSSRSPVRKRACGSTSR